ncbi:hypothetical protein TCON_0562 [Astathelohania contejeani]|uniref:Uncharacterized protein n=1 Tax=Astathelohania contejeani TaxID=164912 RepID=A0ABQ7I1A0_9MICR|nr:hypothetical protein TCON_0562 [Thelohania contejeani]
MDEEIRVFLSSPLSLEPAEEKDYTSPQKQRIKRKRRKKQIRLPKYVPLIPVHENDNLMMLTPRQQILRLKYRNIQEQGQDKRIGLSMLFHGVTNENFINHDKIYSNKEKTSAKNKDLLLNNIVKGINTNNKSNDGNKVDNNKNINYISICNKKSDIIGDNNKNTINNVITDNKKKNVNDITIDVINMKSLVDKDIYIKSRRKRIRTRKKETICSECKTNCLKRGENLKTCLYFLMQTHTCHFKKIYFMESKKIDRILRQKRCFEVVEKETIEWMDGCKKCCIPSNEY